MVRELPQSSALTLDDEEDVLELEHLVAKPRGLAGFAGQQLRTRKRLLGIVTGSVLLLTVVAVTVMTVSGFQTGSSSEEMDFEDIQGDSKPSFLGTGTCDLAQFDPEAQVSRVHCLSSKIAMARGQTVNAMMILANPFPIGEEVVMINQTAQMVDETLRPVPLTEVYVHHYVSSYRFLLGNGAELRGSMTRAPMPEPYAMMVNGTQVDEEHFRITNIQLINTVGLTAEAWKPCLECWCKAEANSSWDASPPQAAVDTKDPTFANISPPSGRGDHKCCSNCPVNPPEGGVEPPPLNYQLQYNVTYRSLQPDEHAERLDLLGWDTTGDSVEYQIPKAMGPGSIHSQAIETTIDEACPQPSPFLVVRCSSHQHFGGACITMINLDKNMTICESCPVLGTNPGVPGNEEGYVVRIADDDLLPPYLIEPGTRIRVESKYDASVPRFGVMGLMSAWIAGNAKPCFSPPVGPKE